MNKNMIGRIHDREEVKVAHADELAPGQGQVVAADGQSIASFNVDGTFCAIDNTCTHVGGSLSEGDIEGDNVAIIEAPATEAAAAAIARIASQGNFRAETLPATPVADFLQRLGSG